MFRLSTLVARDAEPAPPTNHTMVNLLVVLLVLFILAVLLVGGLLFLRARRRAARQQETLPVYDDKRLSTSSTASTHRRVMTRPSESIHVYDEKRMLMNDVESPPPSPLPEIRITFPEEVDAAGKRKSGRVVVVRVGENGVGLEPIESPPGYQATEGERFYSLDLDRVGGLVEKARNVPNKEFQ